MKRFLIMYGPLSLLCLWSLVHSQLPVAPAREKTSHTTPRAVDLVQDAAFEDKTFYKHKSAYEDKAVFQWHPSKDALLLTTGSILSVWGTLALMHADSLDGWDLPPFGFERGAEDLKSGGAVLASDVLAAAVITPLLITGWESYGNGNPEPILTDVVMFTETMMITSGLNLLVRSQFQRNRPLTRNVGFTYLHNEAYHSFYSGHASVGFAAAVYTGYTFQARNSGHAAVPWVWTGALATASGVGLFRILGGKHYPSDVVVAAAVGAVIGWAVPAWHRKKPQKTSLLVGSDRIALLWRLP